MAFDLPPAGSKYDQKNENNARRAVELALADILTRLAAAEANTGSGGNAPTASFASIVTNTDVQFTDTTRAGSAPIVAWAWDFGDGGTATAQNPSHTYAAAGTYSVTLTVTDGDNVTDDYTADVVISVPAVGPTANFVFTTNGLVASFTGTATAGSAPITGRAWTFGDNQTGTGGAPTHTYGSAGTYSVRFTVTDSNGLSDSITKSVTVAAVVGRATKLYVGPMGISPAGSGPGNDSPNASLKWSLWLSFNTSPATIVDEIAKVRAAGGFIWFNFAGPRKQWLPGGVYDPSIYQAKVQQYASIPEVAQGVNDGYIGAYLGDEFNLFSTYNGSVSPRDMNDMGLFVKSLWPGILTAVRISAITFQEGWSNTDGVTVNQIIASGGYTGVDYAVSQYARSAFLKGLTIANWYAQEKSIGDSLNLGILPTLNWLGSGEFLDTPMCWDYANNGTSSGVITGVNGSNPEGTTFNCGDPAIDNEKFFVASPAQVEKFFQVVTADPAFMAAGFWTHPDDSFSWYNALSPLYTRSDFVGKFTAAVQNGNNRSNGAGWRTAK